MKFPHRRALIHGAILVLLGLLGHAWIIVRTQVPARDGVGFIDYAVRLRSESWPQVIRQSHHPPGFPMAIAAGAWFAEQFGTELTPPKWVMIAQSISGVAATFAVVAVYLTGRFMFGPAAGFLGGVMFLSLPVCLQVTSDVLSEGVFLFFAAWSIYWGVLCIGVASWRAGVLSGMAAGTAYLTRPEGMEAVVALGIVSVLGGWVDRSARNSLRAIAAVAIGCLPFLIGYAATTGRISNKPTAQQLFGSDPTGSACNWRGTSGPALAVFWDPQTDASQSRWVWAAKSALVEATHTAHGYGLVTGLLAIGWFRHRITRDKKLWLTLVLAALHGVVLWRIAVLVGYVSERHAILLALCASLWSGALFDRWFARWRYGVAAGAVLLLVIGWPTALKPLHPQRSGYREVGEWLATHASPQDEIIDPSAWARFFAGRNDRFDPAANPRPAGARRFIVLEVRSRVSSRLHLLPWAQEAAKEGEQVYHWPSPEQPRVVVYQVPRRS